MKNTKVVALGFAVLNLTIIAAGCGKAGLTGSYSLNETLAGSSGLQNPSIVLNLTDSNGVVSGGGSGNATSLSSSSLVYTISENLTGSESNGIISVSAMTFTATQQATSTTTATTSAYPYGSPYYNPYSSSGYNPYGTTASTTPLSCQFTGTLQVLNGSTVSGTLNLSSAATTSYSYGVTCPTSMTVTGTLTST